jgi:phosphate transport system permease protein
MSDTAPIAKSTDHSSRLRHQQWRLLKDSVARWGVGLGGVSVIIAIVLIFFYLLYVVFPLFAPASAEKIAQYSLPAVGAESIAEEGKSSISHEPHTLYLSLEEQREIGGRFDDKGNVQFFKTHDGSVIQNFAVNLPANTEITSFSAGTPAMARVAYGLSDGSMVVVRHVYEVSYPNDVRQITPGIAYPLGEEPLEIDEEGESLVQLAFQDGEDEATAAAVTLDGRLILTHFSKEEDLFGGSVNLERSQSVLPVPDEPVQYLLLDKEQRNLYVVTADGAVSHFDVSDKESPELLQRLRLVKEGQQISNIQFLAGDISLLVADATGDITQWFAVRDKQGNKVLRPIREFDDQSAFISEIVAEYSRKGFIAVDRNGYLGIYHSTADRLILLKKITDKPLRHVAISPYADALLMEDEAGQLHFYHVDNEHPEISWSALWGKVWYESYDEPKYAWQSSSASNDFEPKLSLTPLVFGTIKAAFYAMLLAIPLAIFGAIYTAYFMAPRLRQLVKPSIETMEALPTVILGFLAGLWLAPMLEMHLPGIFSLLLIMPVGILVFAFAWHHVPANIRHRIPEGWDAALLIPVVLFLGWLSFSLSYPLEEWLFDGNIRLWLQREFGVGFDQRNALVVGLAMGFAVIPTIFSITEDAIFSVPKHLTYGSLALGATPWQTLVRVVILTASPGIFSAVMIGLGRAVGETMIVLMATGNTPVLDFSIFQGMRTLSANIAVEMPESEVDSTHYRVLFLAALVLFVVTFFFNTMAEMVRQRLRTKYSSL